MNGTSTLHPPETAAEAIVLGKTLTVSTDDTLWITDSSTDTTGPGGHRDTNDQTVGNEVWQHDD